VAEAMKKGLSLEKTGPAGDFFDKNVSPSAPAGAKKQELPICQMQKMCT